MFNRLFNTKTKKILDSEKEAIFLHQLYYWMNKPKSGYMHDGEKYIYCTAEGWSEQLGKGYSKRTILRIIDSLEGKGYIKRKRGLKDKYHRITFLTLTDIAKEHFEQLYGQNKKKKGTVSTPISDPLEMTSPPLIVPPETPISKGKESSREKSSWHLDNKESKKLYTKNKYNNNIYIYNTDERESDMLKPVLEEIKKIDLNEVGEIPQELFEKRYETFETAEQKGTYIAFVMLKIWNLVLVDHQIDFKKIDKNTGQALCDSFFHELNEDFYEWLKIVRSIKSSDFMINSGKFNLSLRSSSRVSFVKKIKNQELGVKNYVHVPEMIRALSTLAKSKIEALQVSEIEKKLRLHIQNIVGIKNYEIFYEKATFDWSDWDGRVYGQRRVKCIPEKEWMKAVIGLEESRIFPVFERAYEREHPLTASEIAAHEEYKQKHKFSIDKILNMSNLKDNFLPSC